MNATKIRYGADDLAALFAGASKVVVAKGKSTVEIALKAGVDEHLAELENVALGPTGNLRALIEALNKAKPATSKGVYLRKVAVSSTMGVGVRVDTSSLAQTAA